MNLSIKQIRAFLALVETENFTRAAEKVHMSQPAFSHVISSLEENLGYRLFERDTRKVKLNNDGFHFLKLANNLLNTYNQTVHDLKTRHRKAQLKVVLAAMPSIVVQWVPELLTSFHNKRPDIRIELIDTQWDRCIQTLLNGDTDMALTTTTPALTNIHSELLFTDEFYLVCHRDHPLAQIEHIELQDLFEHNIIGFTKGTSLRLYTDKIFNIFSVEYIVEVSQLTTMMGLVMANFGIGIVTRLALFQFRHQDIVIKKIHDISLERSIFLIKRQGRPLSNPAALFYEHIRENCKLSAKSSAVCHQPE